MIKIILQCVYWIYNNAPGAELASIYVMYYYMVRMIKYYLFNYTECLKRENQIT